MVTTLFLILAGIVIVGGLAATRRIRDTVDGDVPVVTDEVMRRILEEGGSGDEEEPLDEDEIREAEDRFWDEEWDRPDEL